MMFLSKWKTMEARLKFYITVLTVTFVHKCTVALLFLFSAIFLLMVT